MGKGICKWTERKGARVYRKNVGHGSYEYCTLSELLLVKTEVFTHYIDGLTISDTTMRHFHMYRIGQCLFVWPLYLFSSPKFDFTFARNVKRFMLVTVHAAL